MTFIMTQLIDMATFSEEDIDRAITAGCNAEAGIQGAASEPGTGCETFFCVDMTFSFPFRRAVARVSATVFFRRRLTFFARAIIDVKNIRSCYYVL